MATIIERLPGTDKPRRPKAVCILERGKARGRSAREVEAGYALACVASITP